MRQSALRNHRRTSFPRCCIRKSKKNRSSEDPPLRKRTVCALITGRRRLEDGSPTRDNCLAVAVGARACRCLTSGTYATHTRTLHEPVRLTQFLSVLSFPNAPVAWCRREYT